MKRTPIPAGAAFEREMPRGSAARLDRIETALATLAQEERRLTRLNLVDAVQRCREQRRYWEFLRALFSIQSQRGEPSWRASRR